MEYSGTITKLNNELNYGFITVPKLGDVFFSEESIFTDLSFDGLKVEQKVRIEVIETERGLFAKSIASAQKGSSKRTPEATI